jgi:hypothetical protein
MKKMLKIQIKVKIRGVKNGIYLSDSDSDSEHQISCPGKIDPYVLWAGKHKSLTSNCIKLWKSRCQVMSSGLNLNH